MTVIPAVPERSHSSIIAPQAFCCGHRGDRPARIFYESEVGSNGPTTC